jgi:hypothetical protein
LEDAEHESMLQGMEEKFETEDEDADELEDEGIKQLKLMITI